MSNITNINQAIPSIVTYTLQELLDMPSTLNGEQFPLNEKSVDKLVEDIYDNGLLQMMETSRLGDTVILSGGRHRLASIARLYDDVEPDTVALSVLEYAVETPDELVLRVTSSNGSRRMVSAETKELTLASKFGFDAVNIEGLAQKVVDVPTDYDTFNMVLALSLNEVLDMGKQTALVLARALTTKLKAMKVTVTYEATYDVDGTQLTPATKGKLPLIGYHATSVDLLLDLVNAVVNSIDYLAAVETEVPLNVYTEALNTGLNMVDVVELPSGLKVASVATTIKRPSACQRYAAKYVKVLLPGLKSYLSDALDVAI